MKNEFKRTLTVTDPSGEKSITLNIIDEKTMRIVNPNSRAEIGEIKIGDGGEVNFNPIGDYRWPEDAGKCLLECSRGCNGDLWCVAECAAMCSTIIIG